MDAIAQGAVLIFQGQPVKAPAVHSIGLGPIFENIFAKVRVADPFHLPLITPGSGILLLIDALLVDGVVFSEGLTGMDVVRREAERVREYLSKVRSLVSP